MEKVKLELDINQVNLVLNGLAKLPLEHSLETFLYVRAQAESQQAAQVASNESGT